MAENLICGSCWEMCKEFLGRAAKRRVAEQHDRKTSLQVAQEMLDAANKRTDTILFKNLKDLDPKHLPFTFLPDLIINEISNDAFRNIPYQVYSEAVLLIADVCNFTSLAEFYCQQGVSGIEEFIRILNGYISTLAAILLEAGGDILNFAGDAFLVYWEVKGSATEKFQVVQKAYDCALALQTREYLQTKNLGGKLKVKIGIGMGQVVTWILGSPKEFLLFVMAGHGLVETHNAQELCGACDIVVTKSIFSSLQALEVNTFKATELVSGFVRITGYSATADIEESVPTRIESFDNYDALHISLAKIFLPPRVRDLQSTAELKYFSEMAMVTILFVSMPDVPVEDPQILDFTFDIVLACALRFNGVVNKMLLFDKGCTFLLVFGLPGLKHSDAAARGVLCANELVERHANSNIKASVGVTSGTCFCGLVGHPQRHEYTVMGSRVNLAARIMGKYQDESVVLDSATFHLCRDELGDSCFFQLPPRKMKGIEDAGQIYAYKITDEREVLQKSTSMLLLEVNGDSSDFHDCKRIDDCLETMFDETKRSKSLSSALLPVLIVEGEPGCGTGYYLYYTVHKGDTMGYKSVGCCTMPSNFSIPFSTAGVLIQKLLGISLKETTHKRESKILESLPGGYGSQLYLLNHLLHVQFKPPKLPEINTKFQIKETIRLFKCFFDEFSKGDPMIVAICDANFMDKHSWSLIRQLAEDRNYLIVLSLPLNFKEPSVAANLLFLKSHTFIKVQPPIEDRFGSILCWFLGVIAVHKKILFYLKEQTEADTLLLQEILFSRQVSEYTEQVSWSSLGEEQREQFYVLEEFDVPEKQRGHVYALAMKQGTNIKLMPIPSNVNDAVKEKLNFLSVQDRLFLKRAALLGLSFDQHILETVCVGMESKQIINSINKLMKKNILFFTCTSRVVSEENPPEEGSESIKCYHVCFCEKIRTKSPFRSNLGLQRLGGPYHLIRFRVDVIQDYILSYMTEEQHMTMYQEIVNELQTTGLMCMSCREKRMENMEVENGDVGDMRCAPVKMDMNRCACFKRRPIIFYCISTIYKNIGLQLLPPYYIKKAADASNDHGYPIQGLYYALEAEKMLHNCLVSEEKMEQEQYFDLQILKVSLKKAQAKSSLLLGNYYHATQLIQQALQLEDLDLVHLHGLYKPRKFKNILQRYNLLHAETITKLVGMLSKIYLEAEQYKSTFQILQIEFVALTYYPIDFLQMLTFMNSLYRCQCQLKPKKLFRSLEKNTLSICQDRLDKYQIPLSLVEIKHISTAYITLIETNLWNGYLTRAELLARRSLDFLEPLKDLVDIPEVYNNLVQICLHRFDSAEGTHFLNELACVVDETVPSKSHVFFLSAAVYILLLRLKDAEIDEKSRELALKCSLFALQWKEQKLCLFAGDVAFYTSVTMALWALRAEEFHEWLAADVAFSQCFEIAQQLYEDKGRDTYWSIGATLVFFRIKMKLACDSATLDEQRSSILDVLSRMEKNIKLCFPVYLVKYKALKKDLTSLEPSRMLESF